MEGSVSMPPKRGFEVMFQTVNEKSFLIKQNLCFEINPLGVEIWKMLDGKWEIDEIARRLSVKYNFPLEEVRSDVRDFVGKLADMDLITEKERRPSY